MSLTHARAKLERRERAGAQYALVEYLGKGRVRIETSWMPARSLGRPWRRLKSGGYRVECGEREVLSKMTDVAALIEDRIRGGK